MIVKFFLKKSLFLNSNGEMGLKWYLVWLDKTNKGLASIDTWNNKPMNW